MTRPSIPITRRRSAALLAGAAATLAAGRSWAQSRNVLLLGGGSTFAAPLFEAWIEEYRATNPGVDVAYDVIGSGEGVSRFVTGSLDFAATDAPLAAARRAEIAGGVVHLPVTAGMVALAYHLPADVPGELRLPRDVVGDVFTGRITSWDDARIAAANPDLALPSRTIYPVVRTDPSGTTYAFTNHLEAASVSWQASGQGATSLANWPQAAIRARGNEGVAAQIVRGEGTIGYVEYGFAARLGLPMAALENAQGAFVRPDAAAGEAAIAAAAIPDDLVIVAPDPAGADAYPIVTFTWVLLHETPPQRTKADAVRRFVRWAVTEGQHTAPELGFVPLPATVAAASLAALDALK